MNERPGNSGDEGPALRVRGLSKRFESTQAMADLSFDLDRGQALALVGPNGAGKTTTLRMLATLLEPDQGEISILGRSTADPFSVRPLIGYMPDVLGIYPEMLVREYLEFFGRAYALEEHMLGFRLKEVVAFAGIGTVLESPASGLSRGMLQRVALARALLHDPPFLLLDEPAAGLDPRSRAEFREMLTSLLRQGKTAVVSSHVLADLEETCDRIVVMEEGHLLCSETMRTFLERARGFRLWRVRVASDGDRAHAILSERHEAVHLRWDGKDLLFETHPDSSASPSILRDLVAAGLDVEGFAEVQLSLEQAYLARTTANPPAGAGNRNDRRVGVLS